MARRTRIARPSQPADLHANFGGEDLRRGDILLYKGGNWIAWLIEHFDGTEYSHSSICLQPGASCVEVGEATGGGLKSDPLRVDRQTSAVCAFRLKARPDDLSPVISRAKAYVDIGNQYAYNQIVLLAFLCLTRRLIPLPGVRRLCRSILDQAASWLAALSSAGSGPLKPMICSEFVYRCYDEAYHMVGGPIHISGILPLQPPLIPRPNRGVHPYSLLMWAMGQPPERVRSKTPTEPLEAAIKEYSIELAQDDRQAVWLQPNKSDEDQRELLGSIHNFADRLYDAMVPRDTSYYLFPHSESSSGDRLKYLQSVCADFVTPGDLAGSDSLYQQGCLVGDRLPHAARTGD